MAEARGFTRRFDKWMGPVIAAIASSNCDEVLARPEPRRHALLYLQGVLSEIARKNSWQVAQHARQAHPYGIQRLLSTEG
jgi:hypothetical protein